MLLLQSGILHGEDAKLRMFICQSVSVCLSACLPGCLSVRLYVRMYVCTFVRM